MGLYNFKAQFVPFIMDGRKTHTIRAERKNVEKPGNTVHLYTGLRQKGARLLMRVPCVKVEEIMIEERSHLDSFYVEIDGIALDSTEKEALARRDGFRDFQEMQSFWDGRLPFKGHIIHWQSPRLKNVEGIRKARTLLRQIDPSLDKNRKLQ